MTLESSHRDLTGPIASSSSCASQRPKHDFDDTAIFKAMMELARNGSGVSELQRGLLNKLELAKFAPDAIDDVPFLLSGLDSYNRLIDSLVPGRPSDSADRFVAKSNAAAIVMDRRHRIVAINAAAEEEFGARQGQVANLVPMDRVSRSALEALSSELPLHPARHAVARIEWNDTPFLVELTRLEAKNTDHPAMIGLRCLHLSWQDDNEVFLDEAFGLTSAERAICRMVFEGASPNEICRRRSCSISTLRAQLHAIYRKTETAGQAELILLLAKLDRRAERPAQANQHGWRDPLARESLIARANGKMQAWTWLGDPAGIPAVFLHGGAQGYFFPPPFEDILASQGIRLLVPSRPGYGNSERDDDLDCIDDAVKGLEALIAQETDRPFVVIANHFAVYVALALAERCSADVQAVVAVGDVLRCGRPPEDAFYAPSRVFEWLAKHAPWVNDATFRAGFNHVKRLEFDKALEFILTSARPFDLAHLLSADMHVYARNLVNFSRAQGYRAELEDLSLRIRPFLPQLRSCRVPVHLLQGELLSRPVQPTFNTVYDELARDLLSQGVIASFEKVPEAAYHVCHQNPEFVARRFADYVRHYASTPQAYRPAPALAGR